jgi:hypothetical protein
MPFVECHSISEHCKVDGLLKCSRHDCSWKWCMRVYYERVQYRGHVQNNGNAADDIGCSTTLRDTRGWEASSTWNLGSWLYANIILRLARHSHSSWHFHNFFATTCYTWNMRTHVASRKHKGRAAPTLALRKLKRSDECRRMAQ